MNASISTGVFRTYLKSRSPGIIHIVWIAVFYVVEVCNGAEVVKVDIVGTLCIHRVAVYAESYDAKSRLVLIVNA